MATTAADAEGKYRRGRQTAKMVLWVFGYGSLIWNPGFYFDEKILGFIKGYKRTFNLACIDHRGTPQDPATTCTLESEEEAVCADGRICYLQSRGF